MMTTAPVRPPSSSTGGHLVATSGLSLPLTAVRLDADARGGLARVVLVQRFHNPHPTSLTVTYVFPLPADAAVSGYSFTVAGTRVVGEIDRRAAARERFEQALLEGKTSALLEQDRTSLFTQEIGNVPPGAEVAIELVLDQRLAFLPEGAWEWRFPTAAAPRYLGSEGRVPDAARVEIDVADAPIAARGSFALTIRDAMPPASRAESTSHRVVTTEHAGSALVTFEAREGERLDRDIVVRWSAASADACAAIDVARPRAGAPQGDAAYGLLTIVPPARASRDAGLARDLVVLLDTSGSMNGAPLNQARRVISALIDTLGDRDRLELIEFSSSARRWKREAVSATASHRKAARAWLASLRASGGTEMRDGIVEALSPLGGESQRQVLLVTDGQIGFEREVIAAILERLPSGACVHTVGVGSAVNRSLTSAAARAGRGTETVIAIDEDAERAAKRLVAHTAVPLVVDVVLEGSALLAAAPARRAALFAASPVLASVKLQPEGGELVVRGRTPEGTWEQRVRVPACAPGEGAPAVTALFAREAVEDLEMEHAAGRSHEVDEAIEKLGLDFQIATRLTSWVAIGEEPSVDPLQPMRRVRMPQELPYGMSMEGLGLRGARAMPAMLAAAPMAMGRARHMAAPPAAAPARGAAPRPIAQGAPPAPGFLKRTMDVMRGILEERAEEPKSPPEPRRARGRVVKSERGVLVIEVTVAGDPLAWAPGKDAVLTWADGIESRAKITRATRDGTMADGEIARLFVHLDPSDAARSDVLRSIAIGHDRAPLVIEL